MRPEAVLGPKTTGRPHETMDKMDKGLPHQQIEVPRSIPMYNEKIGSLTLQVFADASSKGVCAVVYAVVDQLKGKSQGLLISKSRLSKKNLTIARLELIAAHMPTNLLSNAKIDLRKYPTRIAMDGQTAQQC